MYLGSETSLIPAWRLRGFIQAKLGALCGVGGGNSLAPKKLFVLLGLFLLFFLPKMSSLKVFPGLFKGQGS